MKIRALIIDDEKLARSRLKRMLRKYSNVEVVGEAQDGVRGCKLVEDTQPDVIFLDIRMPALSGFEMLKKMEVSPYIVFTTAYDEYALQAFEENTIDYLLKPISDETLERALSKLMKILETGSSVRFDLKRLLESLKKREKIIRRFSVRVGERMFIVPASEVFFFRSEDKYTFLNTSEKRYIIPFTLKELEARLDPDAFSRVHRSFIVNVEHVASIHKWFGGRLKLKMKNGTEIPVSQYYVSGFKKKIHA